jgi:hypothetical protein
LGAATAGRASIALAVSAAMSTVADFTLKTLEITVATIMQP